MMVSLLHTVFDMLAFKNDIGFWKNNKVWRGRAGGGRVVLCCVFLQAQSSETYYQIGALLWSARGRLPMAWTQLEGWSRKKLDVQKDVQAVPTKQN